MSRDVATRSPTQDGAPSFPDVFEDLASAFMPRMHRKGLEWVEHLALSQSSVLVAADRITSYFLTDIEFEGETGEDEKEQWTKCLDRDIRLPEHVKLHWLNSFVYGISAVSVMDPFNRLLTCPGKDGHRCGFTAEPRRLVNRGLNFHFDIPNLVFRARCPSCDYEGPWMRKDVRVRQQDKIRLRHWSAHDLRINEAWASGRTEIRMQVPQEVRRAVQVQDLLTLEDTPWEMIKAAVNNVPFVFDPSAIFYHAEPTIAGVRTRGWGMSPIYTRFREIWGEQALNRQVEALMLDYTVPKRVIMPDIRGATGAVAGGAMQDIAMSLNQGNLNQFVAEMVAHHRRDPASVYAYPWPIKYAVLGGEASQLAPKDLMEFYRSKTLDALNLPINIMQLDLAQQSAGPTLRLFESLHLFLVRSANRLIRWIADRIAGIMNWEPADIKLKRVTHADDVQFQMMLLQLMSQGTLNKTDGMAAIGIDQQQNMRKQLDEAKQEAKAQREAQEEMEEEGFGAQVFQQGSTMMAAQQGAQGGSAGQPQGQGGQPQQGQPSVPGAMPPSVGLIPPGQEPKTIEDVASMAKGIAQQLFGQPESLKDSALRQLKQQSTVVHAAVKQELEKLRGQSRLIGGEYIRQQAAAGGGMPPA